MEDFSLWGNVRQTDEVNLAGYENDPAVGKYVNQDGLQQLRHYLKVGPYRSHLKGGSGSNPFFGYLRQVLTRRPVSLIHGSQGHDLSNIANVHYSPGPDHEHIPSPGVDHSPRGFPVPGTIGEKHGRKLIPGPGPIGDEPFHGPIKPPGYGITISKKFGVAIKHPPAQSRSSTATASS